MKPSFTTRARLPRGRIIYLWSSSWAEPLTTLYASCPETQLLKTNERLQLLNLDLKSQYKDGINQLGFSLEDLLEEGRDAALGNGGLGPLPACYLDSSATQDLPVWGYGSVIASVDIQLPLIFSTLC